MPLWYLFPSDDYLSHSHFSLPLLSYIVIDRCRLMYSKYCFPSFHPHLDSTYSLLAAIIRSCVGFNGALVLKSGRSLVVVVVDWVGAIFASCVCAVILVSHLSSLLWFVARSSFMFFLVSIEFNSFAACILPLCLRCDYLSISISFSGLKKKFLWSLYALSFECGSVCFFWDQRYQGFFVMSSVPLEWSMPP